MGAFLDELDRDPHPLLARLRARAPVSWVDELGGWLVTGHAAATTVLLDAAAFTVDDPRFTTARVTGASMLSTDGAQHARHREPFAHVFRPADVERSLGEFIRAEAARLVAAIRSGGASRGAELRTSFAGPLAAAVMAEALGLSAAGVTPDAVLAWYRDIVTAVAALPAAPPATGDARVPVTSFGALEARLREAIRSGRAPLLATASRSGALRDEEVIANAAVALFGGIETMEGMICNAVLCLTTWPGAFALAAEDLDQARAAVEESLRLEPAAAVVDRYATRDVAVGGARIRGGDYVRVSISGANRDPAVFPEPDRFLPRRPGVGRHLAFARGPHFCVGAHLARLEAVTAVRALASGLPGVHLDPEEPAEVRGLVFRKPATLLARWPAGPREA